MKKNIIKFISVCLSVGMTVASLTACVQNTATPSNTEVEESTETVEGSGAENSEKIDYLVLVNKTNELPDNWEKTVKTVKMTNSIGDDVEVEEKAYEAYLKLKEELEKENIYVDLDSARRNVADQQRIMDDFTKRYGADYAAKTVAAPGYSEHHTGLALDLYLIIDGKDITENEDMIQYTDIWKKIHEKLPQYGFILRYIEDKEYITGYGYEPWHIRYVDNPDIAKEIMSKGITLEEYLGKASSDKPEIDLGNSKVFTKEELKAAALQVKCAFAGFGCTLKSLRYGGDECNSQENIDYVNSLQEGANYTRVIEIFTNFHTPKEGTVVFDPDKDMKDYQWLLVETENDGWQIVAQGY